MELHVSLGEAPSERHPCIGLLGVRGHWTWALQGVDISFLHFWLGIAAGMVI